MGDVYEEFAREMAAVRRRYAGHPRREMLHLLLMALEREELVSIGYRESLMKRRLAAMPIDDSLREVIHHALVWIWKDEEMHAIYLRGGLLKLGGLWLRISTFARQFAGVIGGWSASALQHSRWTQAPISRACAQAIALAGLLLGKIPRDVRRHLE